METRIIFIYDEPSRKWQVVATGCKDKNEARQAFNAVLLTCQSLDVIIATQSKVKEHPEGFEIIPAV